MSKVTEDAHGINAYGDRHNKDGPVWKDHKNKRSFVLPVSFLTAEFTQLSNSRQDHQHRK